jgi:pantoate--beta-alanine ligase
LNPEQRCAATVLSRSLFRARDAFIAGERDAGRIKQIVSETLAKEPLVRPQYISCADLESLQELDFIADRALLSLAVYVGTTRLIDNIVLGE